MTHEMKDMRKGEELCEIKTRLMDMVKAELNKGVENINAMELGQVVDMIKDLAEAEKCCNESEKFRSEKRYYDKVGEAMDDYDPEEDDPWDEGGDMEHADVSSRGRSGRNRNMTGRRSVRGRRPGDNWQSRNDDGTYAEGASMQHGEMMNGMYGMQQMPMRDMRSMNADEQFEHIKSDISMMWQNATPDQRKRVKENMLKLVNGLTV